MDNARARAAFDGDKIPICPSSTVYANLIKTDNIWLHYKRRDNIRTIVPAGWFQRIDGNAIMVNPLSEETAYGFAVYGITKPKNHVFYTEKVISIFVEKKTLKRFDRQKVTYERFDYEQYRLTRSIEKRAETQAPDIEEPGYEEEEKPVSETQKLLDAFIDAPNDEDFIYG